MIKIVAIEAAGEHRLKLSFSDGSFGVWDAWPLFSGRSTELTKPLLQPAEFARAFIEAGALAWPNGLELAPWSLRTELDEAGLLQRKAA